MKVYRVVNLHEKESARRVVCRPHAAFLAEFWRKSANGELEHDKAVFLSDIVKEACHKGDGCDH